MAYLQFDWFVLKKHEKSVGNLNVSKATESKTSQTGGQS